MFVSAEALAFVAAGAFVAALFVSLPAAPLGSVVAVPPEPPWQPLSATTSAAPIRQIGTFRLIFFAFIVLLSLWFGLGGALRPFPPLNAWSTSDATRKLAVPSGFQ